MISIFTLFKIMYKSNIRPLLQYEKKLFTRLVESSRKS